MLTLKTRSLVENKQANEQKNKEPKNNQASFSPAAGVRVCVL